MPPIDWTYTAIMVAAVLACSLLLRGSQKSLPLSRKQKLGIGIGAFCGAMIGAKLPFVIADWQGMLSGTAWFAHGKTIMCGIVGGYFGVEIAKWAMNVRVKTGDSFAAPVAIAVAIGRLACFRAGCCYGTPSDVPWAVSFPIADGAEEIHRHPTQLYESAFHFAMAILLIWLGRRELLRGQLIKLYILCYLGYRFLTEFIRPEPHFWFGLTAYQWAALALAPLFVALWIRDHKRIFANVDSAVS